ncbi:hypothetical protein L1887_46115 [Cichorium endivia]|nr:hypothetical protein L1887_46115 [Cichorium endivia]
METTTPRASIETASDRTSKNKLTARVHFFLVFSALCVSSFLSALDLTTVSTALPTIVADLQNDAIRFSKHRPNTPSPLPKPGAGGTYIWIGAAYTIAGMAILPWTGGLCEIWGRKAILLTSLFFFLFGSVICGASHSLEMMIIGRVLQGVGDGGIISLSEIVVADLVRPQPTRHLRRHPRRRLGRRKCHWSSHRRHLFAQKQVALALLPQHPHHRARHHHDQLLHEHEDSQSRRTLQGEEHGLDRQRAPNPRHRRLGLGAHLGRRKVQVDLARRAHPAHHFGPALWRLLLPGTLQAQKRHGTTRTAQQSHRHRGASHQLHARRRHHGHHLHHPHLLPIGQAHIHHHERMDGAALFVHRRVCRYRLCHQHRDDATLCAAEPSGLVLHRAGCAALTAARPGFQGGDVGVGAGAHRDRMRHPVCRSAVSRAGIRGGRDGEQGACPAALLCLVWSDAGHHVGGGRVSEFGAQVDQISDHPDAGRQRIVAVQHRRHLVALLDALFGAAPSVARGVARGAQRLQLCVARRVDSVDPVRRHWMGAVLPNQGARNARRGRREVRRRCGATRTMIPRRMRSVRPRSSRTR